MRDVTVCFTYFKSLALANFSAALYSVRQQQGLSSMVEKIVIVDNDAEDDEASLQAVIDDLKFPVPVHLVVCKHGDASRTHSWSTNRAVSEAQTPWVLFTRADYLLDNCVLKKFREVAERHDAQWRGFVTSSMRHLHVDISVCEQSDWRAMPQCLQALPGANADYTVIDAGVWFARSEDFRKVNGLDERLTAWGHAQTHFQYKLHMVGVEFVRLSEVLFFHPLHAAPRDINVAHQQVQSFGISLKDMWKRYEGVQPYS